MKSIFAPLSYVAIVASFALVVSCSSSRPDPSINDHKVTQAKLDSIIVGQKNLEKKLAPLLALVAGKTPEKTDTTRIAIPLDNSPILGDKNGKVTMVVFIDVECPYCARFATTVDMLLLQHPVGLKVVIKNFPLAMHANSLAAHRALVSAGMQGKYQSYFFRLMANSRSLSDSTYKAIGVQTGLDLEKFEIDRKSDSVGMIVERDIKLGNSIGVPGTPTVYVNGRHSQNYISDVEELLK